MPQLTEHLDGPGALKATMLQAHLAWAEKRIPGAAAKLAPRVAEESRPFLGEALLATQWVPFSSFVEIDRTIAELVGGPEVEVWRQMGRHSASVNLGGVYTAFVKAEPHRFIQRMTILHGRFQSFGRPLYQETGERSGRIQIDECEQFSPVYCATLRTLPSGSLNHAILAPPGAVQIPSSSCSSSGYRSVSTPAWRKCSVAAATSDTSQPTESRIIVS